MTGAAISHSVIHVGGMYISLHHLFNKLLLAASAYIIKVRNLKDVIVKHHNRKLISDSSLHTSLLRTIRAT